MGFIVHELSARVSSYRGDLGGTYWLFGAIGRVSFWGVLVRVFFVFFLVHKLAPCFVFCCFMGTFSACLRYDSLFLLIGNLVSLPKPFSAAALIFSVFGLIFSLVLHKMAPKHFPS